MTKKTVLALFIAVAISRVSLSQETPKIDSASQIKRNEIGINITPAAAILIGSFSSTETRFSASLKHIVRKKNALRFSANYITNWNANFSWYNSNNYEIVSQTDSTQLRRYNQNYNGDKEQINFGYEWRKGKRRLKYFLGSDLILGHTSSTHRVYDRAYKLQKGSLLQGLSYGTSNDTLYYLSPDESIPDSYIDYKRSNSYYAGISPFIGLIYPLSKRIMLSAQFGIDVCYTYIKTKNMDYTNNNPYNSFAYSLDLYSPGLINDFSLTYRF